MYVFVYTDIDKHTHTHTHTHKHEDLKATSVCGLELLVYAAASYY